MICSRVSIFLRIDEAHCVVSLIVVSCKLPYRANVRFFDFQDLAWMAASQRRIFVFPEPSYFHNGVGSLHEGRMEAHFKYEDWSCSLCLCEESDKKSRIMKNRLKPLSWSSVITRSVHPTSGHRSVELVISIRKSTNDCRIFTLNPTHNFLQRSFRKGILNRRDEQDIKGRHR